MTRKFRVVAFVLVTLLVAALVLWLLLISWGDPRAEEASSRLAALVNLPVWLTFALVGVFIYHRRPENAVGWCLSGIGLGMLANGLLIEYSTRGLLLEPGSLPAAGAAGVIGETMWIVPFALILLLLAVYPTGRFLSRRWALIVVPVVLIVFLMAASAVLMWPYRYDVDVIFYEVEPPGSELAFDFFLGAIVLWLVTAVWAITTLVARYRRAAVTTRLQIKWLLYGVAVWAGFLAVNNYLDISSTADDFIPLAREVLFTLGTAVIPLAIMVAVLRYRLYDVDLVISRTLAFGVLAVFITGVYVGIVVGLGSLAGGGGEPNLGLSILATGLVAVLFEPVRVRAQSWANRVVFGRRASPYQVLAGLTARLGETTSDESLLERLATSLGEGTGADATVWQRIGEGFRPAATSSGVIPEGVEPDDADLVVPVVHEDETLGLLTLTAARGVQVSPADERLVSDVAGNVGLMLRNVRLNTELAARAEELAASRRRLVAVQDEERRRLERDLHDGAQQHVVAAAMQLNMAKMVADREGHDQVAAQLEELVDLDQQAVEQLRTIARGIYPPLLGAEGLEAAINGAARSLPITVDLNAEDLPRYPQDIEAAVYFCVTETIRDAIRRNATTIHITLTGELDTVEVEIADDRAGDPGSENLQTLTDRVRAAGGELTDTTTGIHISLPADTRVQVGV